MEAQEKGCGEREGKETRASILKEEIWQGLLYKGVVMGNQQNRVMFVHHAPLTMQHQSHRTSFNCKPYGQKQKTKS
jgi:hypothetical protein